MYIYNYQNYYVNNRKNYSAVSIATGYGLIDHGIGFRVPVEARILTSLRRPDRLWGPPNFYPKGTGGSFPGVKWPGREADPTLPTSTEVKKMWIYTSTPPYVFMA
jgi:hypothetical protein